MAALVELMELVALTGLVEMDMVYRDKHCGGLVRKQDNVAQRGYGCDLFNLVIECREWTVSGCAESDSLCRPE